MNRIRHYLASIVLAAATLPFGAGAYAGDWVYIAKQGDTLWDLCIRYTSKRGCWIEAAKYNNISNDRAIPLNTPIRFPQSWLTMTPPVGQVISAMGEVEYDRWDSGQRAPLAAGDSIHLGSRIITGEGTVRLKLGDHSELLLRENGELVMETLSTGSGNRQWAELQLPRGEVDTTVEPGRQTRFQITTPAAIAAVRGTRYRVDAPDSDSMRSEVLTGSVAVDTSAASTTVPAGYGIAAKRGEALGEARELLPAPALEEKLAGHLPLQITWEAHPQAMSWQLDLYAPTGDEDLLKSYTSNAASYSFTDLALGCYKLTVRAVDQAGFNGLESEAQLCIEPTPPPPPPEPEPEIWWEKPLAVVLLTLIAIL